MKNTERAMKHVKDWTEEKGEKPTLILMSKDVLLALLQEHAKRNNKEAGYKPKLQSVITALEDRINLQGTEVAVVGGKARFEIL